MYVKDIREKFTSLLAKIKVLIGLPSDMMPTAQEVDLMLTSSLENFSGFTIEELELAVITNISRENENYVQCYGRLSFKYLADCLHEYQKVKKAGIIEFRRREESMKPRTIHEPDYIVNSKLFDGLQSFILQNSRFPDYWDWDRTYQHMEENGLIKTSLEEKKEMFEKVKNGIVSGKTNARITAGSIAQRNEAESIDIETRTKTECRRLLIKSFFNL